LQPVATSESEGLSWEVVESPGIKLEAGCHEKTACHFGTPLSPYETSQVAATAKIVAEKIVAEKIVAG
jgi:hypothetical protein